MNILQVKKEDIDTQLLRRAYNGISMRPEGWIEADIQSYLSLFNELNEEYGKYAEQQPELEQDIKESLVWFQKAWLRKKGELLAAYSRCLSVMVTGASNFPTKRNQKANDRVDRLSKEFREWREKWLGRFRRWYNPEIRAKAPISADDPDAIDKLEAKVEKLEEVQAHMVAVNKIVRKFKRLTKKRSEFTPDQLNEKVEAILQELMELGLSRSEAEDRLKPDVFMGHLGYASFELNNNRGRIKATKERISILEQEAKRDPVEDRYIGNVIVRENIEENRIQLIFPGKPSVEVRDILKRHGFRWARSQSAWQRMLNDNGRRAVELVEGKLNEAKNK